MINMMYLVLTAMLALNVSKDILLALDRLDAGYNETTATVEAQNASIYNKLESAYNENSEKAGPWRNKALEVQKAANSTFQLIDDVKKELEAESRGRDEETDKLKRPDDLEGPATVLLTPKSVGGKGRAKEIKTSLEAYRATLVEAAGDDEALVADINKIFDTADRKVSKDDPNKVSWESATFEHFPLIANLTFLSDYQAKIRRMESETIARLSANVTGKDIKVTGVRGIVIPKSTYVTQGDEYEAQVLLAAYDDTQDPIITINGTPLDAEAITNGIGNVKFKADRVGEVKWSGMIKLKQVGQEDTEVPVEGTYFVAPPSVVISPSKMNVLYRGVDNPLEIGVPGVDPAKIRVSGPGVSGSNGNYMARVDKIKGKQIKIAVSVEEEDGTVRSVGSKEFRIKGLPPATGVMYGKATSVRSASAIKAGKVEAKFLDFPFELNLRVTSFEVVVPGYPPRTIKGDKLDSQTKQLVDKLKPGSTITIRNIKALGPKNYRVDNVGIISLDVN
ncbi:MAG: gliding motility protein GldM [Schleiferiaceae bacterium]